MYIDIYTSFCFEVNFFVFYMHLCSTGTGIFCGYTLRNGISDSRDMGINELIFVHLQSYQQCMDSVFDLAFLLTVDVINIIKIFAVIIFIPLEFQ